jgi:acid phosphatase type 7
MRVPHQFSAHPRNLVILGSDRLSQKKKVGLQMLKWLAASVISLLIGYPLASQANHPAATGKTSGPAGTEIPKPVETIPSGTISIPSPAQDIVGGPYVVNATPKSATIVWVVQSDLVKFRPQSGGDPGISPSLQVQKAILSGLKPNTRYEYEIPGHESAKGSFKTPPSASDSAPYRFFLYGDNRTRHDVHRRVMSEMLKQASPDFILQSGDMVADGNDSSLWPIFFDIERDLLRQTVFNPSLGNHERNTDYFRNFFQHDTSYYSFDWGNGHFIVINSDINNVSASKRERDAFWVEQTRWLEEDLASHQGAVYRFVVAHHPPFTAVQRREGDNPHMTALVPMFEQYHVTAALFGHDHNYQHYLKNGIHYIISGGGGAPLYDVNTPPKEILQKVVSIENFVTVDVDGKTAHVKAISIDGTTLDEFDIHGSATH